MGEAPLGLVLLVLAGMMNGSFTLPMKFTHKWAWENTWLVFSVFALLVLPPLLTAATVPALFSVYRKVGLTLVLIVAGFGAGWGVAQVLFGLAVNAIGIALAFSVVLGIAAAVGSLIPLFQLHPEKILTAGGLGVIAGVFLVIVGVGVLAVAGRRREVALGQTLGAGTSFGIGLAFAVFSGLGAALINFGLAYGGPLLAAAREAGADPFWAPNAVWLPLMLSGLIPNFAYCVHLMRKNGTIGLFTRPSTHSYWLLAALMAVFWFASTILYGMASGKLGVLGPVLAWPFFMSIIVISASGWGILTGEWKNAGRKPVRLMLAGIAILIMALFVLSSASRHI